MYSLPIKGEVTIDRSVPFDILTVLEIASSISGQQERREQFQLPSLRM
jgi:hypothetical protein